MSITGALVSTISNTGSMMLQPLYSLWDKFVNVFPGIVWAIILVIFGYILASILGYSFKLLLQKFGLDEQVKRAKLTKAVGSIHLTMILGELLKWYIFIVFLQSAVDVLNLGALTDLLERLVLWLPNVIAAILVLLFLLFLAHFLEMKIVENSNMKGVKTIAVILKYVLITIAAIIALNQIGIDVSLLENLTLIIIGSLAVGIALALGIGLGLGLKKEGESIINEIKKNI